MGAGSNVVNNFWGGGGGYCVDGQGTFRTRPINSPILFNMSVHTQRQILYRTSRYNVNEPCEMQR